MNEADFLYYYSKYYLKALNDIISCEENWNHKEANGRYKSIIIDTTKIKDKISIIPNETDQVKAIEGIATSLRVKAKKSFLKNFFSDLKECDKYTNTNTKTKLEELQKTLEKTLPTEDDMSFQDFLKEIRLQEFKYLE